MLKIDQGGLAPLALADSNKVQRGNIVLAVGNHLVTGQTVTLGIMSANGSELVRLVTSVVRVHFSSEGVAGEAERDGFGVESGDGVQYELG